jgi:futalosine hydrolase
VRTPGPAGSRVQSHAHVALDVLILAAFAPELAPFAVVVGDSMTAIVGGRSVAARIAGIGLAAAAVGAATHLAELTPRAAVLVGTCGAYAGSGLAIGDAVVARRLLLVDPAAIAGAAQFPEPMTIATQADDALADAFAALGARSCSVGTTLAITTDDDGATRIAAATGAEVEHLEAQGVAMACAARAVPFAAILAVANVVGSRGRVEWRENHRHAETVAGELVLRWLHQGARGLPT